MPEALDQMCVQMELAEGVVSLFPMYTPRPRTRMWDRSREGINTLRNSAEKMPPFFIAPVFLMLRVTERRGCLKWNSFGGIFSGLLDQSATRSESFIKMSSSLILSITSS